MSAAANWWEGTPEEEARDAEHDYVLEAFAGLRKAGWHRRSCPRCFEQTGNRDPKLSLHYNTATGGYNCHRCEMRGSLPMWKRAQIWKDDEFAQLARERVTAAKAVRAELQGDEGAQQPGVLVRIFETDSPVFAAARDYCTRKGGKPRGRGLPEETCRAMQISAVRKGWLAGRVIVPIPDYASPESPLLRGWVARDFTGLAERPYQYPKRMDRRGLIWNEPALYTESAEPAFIGEGVFDAAPLWPDACACLGKPVKGHFAKFLQARRPLVVILDGDAWRESQRLAWDLSFRGKKAAFIRFPPKTDPNEVDPSWIRAEAKRLLWKT